MPAHSCAGDRGRGRWSGKAQNTSKRRKVGSARNRVPYARDEAIHGFLVFLCASEGGSQLSAAGQPVAFGGEGLWVFHGVACWPLGSFPETAERPGELEECLSQRRLHRGVILRY
jgi:hypothetical protein